MITKLTLAAGAIGAFLMLALLIRKKEGHYGYGKALGYLLSAAGLYFIFDRALLRFLICGIFFRDATTFTIVWGDTYGGDWLGATDATPVRILFSVAGISAIQELAKFIIWENRISRGRLPLNTGVVSSIVIGASLAAACVDIALNFSISISPSAERTDFIRINLIGVVLKYICIHLLSGFAVISVLKKSLYQFSYGGKRTQLLVEAFAFSYVIHAVFTALFFNPSWMAAGIAALALIAFIIFYKLKLSAVKQARFDMK